MIKVFLADDHFIVRKGLTQIISEEKDMKVVGEANCADEIFEQAAKTKIDVLVLDISMPGKNGFDTLIELKKTKTPLKTLILSVLNNEEIALRAFQTGARGYLTKDCAPEELVKAIRKIYKGGEYIGNSLSCIKEKMQDHESPKKPHEILNDREFQVFSLIASGYSLKQISEKLHLNIKTISRYKASILEKMKLRSNIDLTHYAIKNGIMLPDLA